MKVTAKKLYDWSVIQNWTLLSLRKAINELEIYLEDEDFPYFFADDSEFDIWQVSGDGSDGSYRGEDYSIAIGDDVVYVNSDEEKNVILPHVNETYLEDEEDDE